MERNAELRKEKIDVQEIAEEYDKSHRIIDLIYSSTLNGWESYTALLSFVKTVGDESSLKAMAHQCPRSIQGPFIDILQQCISHSDLRK